MTEKMKQFQAACQIYFSSLGIAELRTYGREVGVSRPTAKKKEELIEDIIGILSGTLAPIAISKQGAPVKNDRVDERIPAKIDALKREFFANDVMMDIPKYDFRKEYQKMIEQNTKIIRVANPEEEKRGFVSKIVTRGQVVIFEEKYYVFPLDCASDGRAILIPDGLVQEKDLREGDCISCYTRESPEGDVSVATIVTVNDLWTEKPPLRPNFDECAACRVKERIRFYSEEYEGTALKFVDWLMPVAKGQRGCVISAPKAGKTRFLLQLAKSASALNPKLEVFTLLVDQSPETVGEYQRLVGKDKLFYSTYDDDAERQVFVADFVLKRAKRKVENGKNVLLIVDSLSALARAFNDTDASSGGKTLSCGLEIKTVRYMKKYFGAARCLENGGSLTILGAVSADTGNPFDDVVCTEFSSRANYEIHLSNAMAIRRIFPAIDFAAAKSKEGELLRTEREEEVDFLLRNEVIPKLGGEGLIKLLNDANSYQEFLTSIENI